MYIVDCKKTLSLIDLDIIKIKLEMFKSDSLSLLQHLQQYVLQMTNEDALLSPSYHHPTLKHCIAITNIFNLGKGSKIHAR